MQKQNRVGRYVLLLLLAMLGITAFMVEKEIKWQRSVAAKESHEWYAALMQVGEHAYNRIFVNGHILAGDYMGDKCPIETDVTEKSEDEQTGKEAEENTPTYTIGVEDVSYFDDALFIGDSRTVGIMEYGYFEQADFFADVSMSVYKVWNRKIAVNGKTKQKLEDILAQNSYGKVYVMLGINELGYDYEQNVRKYTELIGAIREAQPDAVIYVCGNLHVTEKQSAADEYFNNDNINRFNEAIATLADGENCFYIDINPMFDDENGNLNTDYSSDEAHVKAQYYVEWCDWLMTQAVVKTE